MDTNKLQHLMGKLGIKISSVKTDNYYLKIYTEKKFEKKLVSILKMMGASNVLVYGQLEKGYYIVAVFG